MRNQFGLLAIEFPKVLLRRKPSTTLRYKKPNALVQPPDNCLILPRFLPLFLFLIIHKPPLLYFFIKNMKFFKKQNFKFSALLPSHI